MSSYFRYILLTRGIRTHDDMLALPFLTPHREEILDAPHLSHIIGQRASRFIYSTPRHACVPGTSFSHYARAFIAKHLCGLKCF